MPNDPLSSVVPKVQRKVGTGSHAVALLIDDHQIILDGLSQLMTEIDPKIVIHTATTLEEGLRLLYEHPDLVLLDLGLSDSKGIDTLQRVLANAPFARIGVISGSNETGRMRAAYKAGACAYIPKSFGPDQLRNALEHFILKGGFYFPEDALTASNKDIPPRALEVLRLVAAGLENKEIAAKLGVSPMTIKDHVSNLLLRMEVTNRIELINAARQHGLLD